MTLFESGDSTEDVSLGAVLETSQVSGCSDLDLDRLAFLICRGGWPESVDMDEPQKRKIALLEMKLGSETLINEDAETLKKVLRRIDADKMGEPSFMAVVTGTERYAYRRGDGILVIPIGGP